MEMDPLTRKLAVIVHADVADSTSLVREDESLAHQRIQDAFRRFSKTIERYDGIARELRGDALIGEFSRSSDAVAAAVEFQASNAAHLQQLPDRVHPVLRIGIAMGEVVIADDTVTGEGVVLAQRLEQSSEAGGVCIQGAVYETVPKRLPFQYRSLGELKLKGFDEPLKAYAVSAKIEGSESMSQAGNYSAKVSTEYSSGPSVAVLPLNNMSGDPEQEYFSDGITEDITTALSCFRSFSVIARNSAFAYKGKSVDVRQIARELGARYVVEGSVRKAGDRVRITAQLVDAITGSHIWAEHYDRNLDDIFTVQDEIVTIISGRIAPEVDATERQKAKRKATLNLDAWDCYHLGMSHFYKFSKEDNFEAQNYFRRAVELDPAFGGAYSRLAYSIVLGMLYYDVEAEPVALDEALALARLGVEIDDKDAWAHLAVGKIHSSRKEYELSLAECETAIKLNPYLATAHCAIGDTMAYMERPEQAIPSFEEAIRLSPHDPWRWAFMSYRSLVHIFLEQYEEAADWANKALQVPNCQYWANAHLCSALGHLEKLDAAQIAASELLRRKPGFSLAYTRKRLFYIKSAAQVAQYIDGLRKAGLPEQSQ